MDHDRIDLSTRLGKEIDLWIAIFRWITGVELVARFNQFART